MVLQTKADVYWQLCCHCSCWLVSALTSSFILSNSAPICLSVCLFMLASDFCHCKQLQRVGDQLLPAVAYLQIAYGQTASAGVCHIFLQCSVLVSQIVSITIIGRLADNRNRRRRNGISHCENGEQKPPKPLLPLVRCGPHVLQQPHWPNWHTYNETK